ncbi:cobalt transporter [Alcaligenes pakistanensis]|uniref:Cobalt transporter n=1 Tax=Alcaligenes pakistanensis TaxID=1482717 RepID=A0A8H9II01_9BURK|nr:cation diffusion facilitator family transporter [Alcaligenes pakistanensis]MBP6623420.1 cation transporter [Alcaligenes sp.]GHC43144.1 cobalt transporter [Alcaligenes pakistanensis]
MEKITPTELDRHRGAQRSTWVSVIVNIGLSLLQIIVGLFAHSQALIADAIHSLSDLLSDFVVLVANRHSRRAPDADHPYGHLRYETAATLAIGGILLAVGLGMLWNAVSSLRDPSSIEAVHPIALVIAFVALCSKELLFRYMLRVAKRLRSTMLVANAWHARSDAASSLVVSVGVMANLAGLPLGDPLAASVVGLMILRMGWKFSIGAFHDLTDKAVDQETEERIAQLLRETPGVEGIHQLRTRKLGDMIWVEVDLEMDGTLSITEGHAIAVLARDRVMMQEPVLDVMTHFDPVTPNAKA